MEKKKIKKEQTDNISFDGASEWEKEKGLSWSKGEEETLKLVSIFFFFFLGLEKKTYKRDALEMKQIEFFFLLLFWWNARVTVMWMSRDFHVKPGPQKMDR